MSVDEADLPSGQVDLDVYNRLVNDVERLTPETIRLREMVDKLTVRQRVAKTVTILAVAALAAVVAMGFWVYSNDQRVRDALRVDLQISQYAICENLNAEKAAIITAFSNAGSALNPKPPDDASPEAKALYEDTRDDVDAVLEAIRSDASMEQVACERP